MIALLLNIRLALPLSTSLLKNRMPCPGIDRVVEVYCGKLLAAVWGFVEQSGADVAVACHYLHLFQRDVQGIQPVIDHALPDTQRIDLFAGNQGLKLLHDIGDQSGCNRESFLGAEKGLVFGYRACGGANAKVLPQEVNLYSGEFESATVVFQAGFYL